MSIDSSARPDFDPKAPARKFLFDRSFDGDLGLDPEEKPVPTFSEEELEAAKKQAFEEGRTAGLRAAAESEEKAQTLLVSEIDRKLSSLLDEASKQWKDQMASLLEMTFVITRKILPRYAEEHGLQEIEAIVSRVISELAQEPRLVFRVPEASFETLNAKISELAEQRAFSGKIVVLGEASFGPSDCRIEWADGGIERDFKKLWQEIDQIMEPLQKDDQNKLEALAADTAENVESHEHDAGENE